MGLRISVDTGGTFTDVVAGGDGREVIGKAPTTPDRIFVGMRGALENAAEQLGLSLPELLGETDLLIYGTTRATNAIVQGAVAKTVFLVTAGFPDILVLKEGGKHGVHDFETDYPDPYIPQAHTFEIDERIDAEGGVVTPLDREQARSVLELVGERGFEAVAVCLLWAVANPAHEQALAALIEEVLPGVPYTLSHRLIPIVREYRRASATAIDASLKPLMQAHLRRHGGRSPRSRVQGRDSGEHLGRRLHARRRADRAAHPHGQVRPGHGAGRGADLFADGGLRRRRDRLRCGRHHLRREPGAGRRGEADPRDLDRRPVDRPYPVDLFRGRAQHRRRRRFDRLDRSGRPAQGGPAQRRRRTGARLLRHGRHRAHGDRCGAAT